MERFCEASHKCREVALKIYTRPQGGNSSTSTANERFQEGAEDSSFAAGSHLEEGFIHDRRLGLSYFECR